MPERPLLEDGLCAASTAPDFPLLECDLVRDAEAEAERKAVSELIRQSIATLST